MIRVGFGARPRSLRSSPSRCSPTASLKILYGLVEGFALCDYGNFEAFRNVVLLTTSNKCFDRVLQRFNFVCHFVRLLSRCHGTFNSHYTHKTDRLQQSDPVSTFSYSASQYALSCPFSYKKGDGGIFSNSITRRLFFPPPYSMFSLF